MTTEKLPFKLTTESTSEWLQSLSQLNSANSANQLNTVIKTLRSSHCESLTILKTLIQITPTVMYIASTLEEPIAIDSNKTSRKIEQLCIQLLRNLSLAFCMLTNKKELSDEEKNQAIFFAAQLIGHAQCSAAVFHQTPSSTLWKKTGELYLASFNRKVLQLEIKHRISYFKNLSTIESVIKRNILFTISSPYQHNTNHIKELFLITEKYADFLQLSSTNSEQHLFFWNPNSDIPPNTNKKLDHPSYLYINTNDFISLTQNNDFSNNLKDNALRKIFNPLSGYKNIIETPVASALIIKHLIIGFRNITDYLDKSEKLNKIEQLSSLVVESKTTNNMSIEPFDFESSHLNPSSKPLSSNSKKLLEDLPTVKMLNTTEQQYIIAETKQGDCNIGEMGLICHTQEPPELVIIRQIKTTNQTGTVHILLEIIPGAPSIKSFALSEIEHQLFITIENEHGNKAIFVNPIQFSNRQFFKLNPDYKHSLGQLIDYSPFYMHYLS